MKISEIRELPDQDIEAQIAKSHAALFKFRFNAGNDDMQRAGEIRGLRKGIARMKTVLKERQAKAASGSTSDNSTVRPPSAACCARIDSSRPYMASQNRRCSRANGSACPHRSSCPPTGSCRNR